MRFILFMLLILTVVVQTIAQDTPETTTNSLIVGEVTTSIETDLFGQTIYRAYGELVNQDESAYERITLLADVFDEDGELIGEGLGFPVDACGTGLLPDFALQPGQSQPFSILLEFFVDRIQIDQVEVSVQGTTIDPLPVNTSTNFNGLQKISALEVVNVEWLDPVSLRFGAGCNSDVFTELEWFSYSLETDAQTVITHPAAERVTEALLVQLGLTDPAYYNRSFLTFPANARRIVYQTEINVFLTAEPDGSFKRLIYDDLSRRSLQGFIWLPEGRFLAYYYGAYGEEVVYFTASVEGQLISGSIYEVMPSMTIPGPTPDGGRAVITTTVEDVTGYYLKETRFLGNEFLFEADPPGNNWPAPIYTTRADNNQTYIYIVRPVDDVPLLQCFDMATRRLHDLTAVPLELTFDTRAWTWLSPDGNTIALAANGVNGGLWLVDLPTFGICGVPLAG